MPTHLAQTASMTKILLAEDHLMVREGLKLLLLTEPDLQVAGETGDGTQVETMVEQLRPDLLLLDLDLPGRHGVDLALRLPARYSWLRIIILTAGVDLGEVRRMLAAGIDGYLLKRADAADLVLAIRTVLAGKLYVSPPVAALLARHDLTAGTGAAQAPTAREQEIIAMIARGLSNEEIAAHLHRSVLTVRKHRRNLMVKLGLHNAVEVAAYASRHGLTR